MSKIISKEDYTKKKVKSKKRFLVFSIVVMILFVLSIVYFVYYGQIKYWAKHTSESTTNPVWAKIVSWLPPLGLTLGIVVCLLFLIVALKFFMGLGNPKTQHRRTVKKLIESIIQYSLIIIAFIIILKAWGADVSAIVISTGGIVVFLGLCLKSIVEDFACGVIIVFERNLDVGDIVTVDGFKGTIREIGTRVTAIENINNDIMLVNNSDLKSIINHTTHLTRVILKILLPKTIDETMFKEAFYAHKSEFEKACPDMQGEIKYYGIVAFDKFNTNYAVEFYVPENRSLQSQKAINAVFNKIMKEKGWLQ